MGNGREVAYKNRYKNKAPSRGDNLVPYRWKPGQSGNPLGRTRGSPSLIESLKKHLNRHPEDVDAIALALVKLGKGKSINQLGAIKELFDRVDGRVIEKHQIEGELPIQIQFVHAHLVLDNKDRDVVEGEAREIKELGEGA